MAGGCPRLGKSGGSPWPVGVLDLPSVVLCEQDPVKLRGKEKSKKHVTAEKLKEKGLEIDIVVEDDFWAMAEAY